MSKRLADIGAIIGGYDTITMVDVGASLQEGEEHDYAELHETGHLRAIGFEANETECDRLNARFGDPHRFLPFFIGDGSKGTFYETAFYECASLLKPNEKLAACFSNFEHFIEVTDTHEVSTVRLDDVEEIGEADFLKLDVQGAEKLCLEGARHLLAEHVMLIKCEYIFIDMYENQTRMADLERILGECGFVMHAADIPWGRCFAPFTKPGEPDGYFRQQVFTDLYFVKDFSSLRDYSSEKLRKFAVLLHIVTRSFDLCCRVLKVLDEREPEGQLADRYVQAVIEARSL